MTGTPSRPGASGPGTPARPRRPRRSRTARPRHSWEERWTDTPLTREFVFLDEHGNPLVKGVGR